MADRLQTLRGVDPVLSQLAIGYSNAEYISTVLFPMAQVPKESGQVPKHTKQSFKVFATERALRAKSNRLNPEDRDFIKFSLDEHDLSVPMDYREADEAEDLDVKAANTFLATEGIALRAEKIAADLAFDPANYGANNKIAIAASDAWTNYTSTTSDPVGVIDEGKEKIRQGIARYPNIGVIGAKRYKALKNHPKILERLTYSQLGVVTPQILAAILDLDAIVVGKGIWASDDGQTTYDIWDDKMLLAYVRPPQPGAKRSVYEPNFGYTVYRDDPQVDTYPEEGGKLLNTRCTRRFKQLLVGADAGYLIY
ncbi:MAG: hypothetical protein RLZZ182_153 [Pseudomonadota bacterium]|jgi:Phage major capsid protein E